MNPLSSWTITAQEELTSQSPKLERKLAGCILEIYMTYDSLWAVVKGPKIGQTAFRMAFSSGAELRLVNQKEMADRMSFLLESVSANYEVSLQFPEADQLVIHYVTTLTPKFPLLIPFWSRDILPLTKSRKVLNEGTVHVHQVGTRSGLLFMSMTKPQTGSIFYFQNLTSLADYCETTRTSLADTVGGKWPELGFALPVTEDDPLPAGKSFVITDAFVLLCEEVPKNSTEITTQFLNHLAAIYLLIPRPEPVYHHWPESVENGINGLTGHKGCWTYAGGHPYLNAYVSDYKTPAEIMVQLAVLLPLTEYFEWKEEESRMIQELKDGLQAFYQEELKTVVRWVPAMEDNLDKSEEQKRERLMDSWYLHHPLMNLARLAQQGDEPAKKLLLDSIDYAISVAHHFKYDWPVFYRMDTLKVVKAETEPGKGGERDVPGAYAHLMLEVWKVTGARKYLNEARTAAKKLEGRGFDIFYQANNTAFSAQAMLRLYKETGDKTYLNLSYACLAGIFKNVQLWDCNYGNGKYFPTFFAVFPLNDAPYTAAYEEQEVYASLTEYLREAEGIDILPSVHMLIAEFIRYTVTRICYYYPPLLPKKMLSQEVKTGEIDPDLWIPLEDIHDGWEQSGLVGQEVYGAGIAFGIVPRQYLKVPKEDFIIYVDYPVFKFKVSKNNSLTLTTGGDKRLNCTLLILSVENPKKKRFNLTTSNEKREKIDIKPKGDKTSPLEFLVQGNQQLKLQWE